jgi:hypothetical protein
MKRLTLTMIFCLSVCVQQARGQTNKTVVPFGFENQNGNSVDSPFNSTALEYQELFRGSLLATVWQAPVVITGFAFRVEAGSNSSFDAVFPQIEIRFSTSSRTPEQMAQSYFSNRGVDEKIVYLKENVRVFATGNQPVNPFEISFKFESPFTYNPQQGNLLVYLKHGQAAGGGRILGVDAQMFGSLNSTTPYASFGSGTFGSPSAYGAIPEFEWFAIPEPGILMLLTLGGSILLGRQVKTHALWGKASNSLLQSGVNLVTSLVGEAQDVFNGNGRRKTFEEDNKIWRTV